MRLLLPPARSLFCFSVIRWCFANANWMGPRCRSALSTNGNKGRWGKEEHQGFLTGFAEHGKDWFAIRELYVPSRTETQIRTHAQKYLKKAEQGLAFPEEVCLTHSCNDGLYLTPQRMIH